MIAGLAACGLAAALLVIPSASADTVVDRFNDHSPFYGAISLTNGGAKCTAGIRVKAGSTIYLTTAAHCYSLINNVWNASADANFVGTVTKRLTSVDTELMTLDDDTSPDGKFFLDGSDFLKVTTIGPVIDNTVGISYSGQTSGVVDNLSIEAVNQGFTLPNGQGTINNAFYLAGPCGFVAQSGDSGAPVYYSALGATQVIGFVVGTGKDQFGCQYTAAVPARDALSALGVTAITE